MVSILNWKLIEMSFQPWSSKSKAGLTTLSLFPPLQPTAACAHISPSAFKKKHTLKRTQLAYRCPAALPPDTHPVCKKMVSWLVLKDVCFIFLFRGFTRGGETLSRTELITLPYWFVWAEGLFRTETKLCNNLNFYHLLFTVESLMGGILYFLLIIFGEYNWSCQP